MMRLVEQTQAGATQAQTGEQDLSGGLSWQRLSSPSNYQPSPRVCTCPTPRPAPSPTRHTCCSPSPGMPTRPPPPQPKWEHTWHLTLPLAVGLKTTPVNVFHQEHIIIPTLPSPSRSRENHQMCTGFSAAPGNLRQGPITTPSRKQIRARSQREGLHRRWDGRLWELREKVL